MPIIGTIASSTRQGISTGSYDSISTFTVSASTATEIDFQNIPQTYKHLQIRGYGLFTGGASAGYYKFNNTSSDYSVVSLFTDGVTIAGTSFSGTIGCWWTAAAGTTPDTPVPFVIDIPDYTSTTKTKTSIARTGWSPNYVEQNSNLWNNTSAINRITFTNGNTFLQNTVISIYGIKES